MIDWLARGAFEKALDEVGAAIVSGRMPEGSVETVDGLVASTGASRSVVREVTRVLGARGLLTASRRVGLRVTPSSSWDLLDPHVIRWRLGGAGAAQQREELRELRGAIEPEAARLAAVRRTEPAVRELTDTAGRLRSAVADRDGSAFHAADRALHGAVLGASGNPMLIRLQAVVDEGLRDRTPTTPVAWESAPADVVVHERLVAAIERRRPDEAGAAMAEIVRGG